MIRGVWFDAGAVFEGIVVPVPSSLTQPIRLEAPFISEGPGDKVFVQQERVKG